MDLNKDSLEKAMENMQTNNQEPGNNPNQESEEPLNNQNQESTDQTPNNQPQNQISEEQEIGFHKGAINTLIAERNELYKMIQNVEKIIQAHANRLKELGVDLNQNQKKE